MKNQPLIKFTTLQNLFLSGIQLINEVFPSVLVHSSKCFYDKEDKKKQNGRAEAKQEKGEKVPCRTYGWYLIIT